MQLKQNSLLRKKNRKVLRKGQILIKMQKNIFFCKITSTELFDIALEYLRTLTFFANITG